MKNAQLIIVCLCSLSLWYACQSGTDTASTKTDAVVVAQQKQITDLNDKIAALEKKVATIEKPPTAPTTTPTPPPTTTCSLDNVKYSGSYSYYLRFLNQSGNTFEVIGKISIYDINAKVRLTDDQLTVISGNVSGKMTLLENCRQLSGSLKTKNFMGETLTVDFVRN